MKDLDIAKFGGTSVADYAAMCNCVRVVTSNPNTQLCVVSACAGVTNLLVELAGGGAAAPRCDAILERIWEIHMEIIGHLGSREELTEQLAAVLADLRNLAAQARMERSDALTDRIVSHGELLSSRLMTEVFRAQGFRAEFFDVRRILRTDSLFGQATPIIEVLQALGRDHLAPLLNGDQIVVTQGFIGSNQEGQTTTLGRGGSDYTAALLGEALQAATISIWTDVTGVYTTDPRLVPYARPIDELTYLEAAEMATFGAKILHPSTLVPAVRQGIPVYVGSSLEPEKGGTWIRARTARLPSFRAVALRRDQTLIVLASPRMVGACGFLARVFDVFARHRQSVDLVSTSEVSIAVTLDASSRTSGPRQLPEDMLDELRGFCHVRVEHGLALLAVIGNSMSSAPGLAARVFTAIDRCAVRMICSGASSHNLCFLLSDQEAPQALVEIHRLLLDHAPGDG